MLLYVHRPETVGIIRDQGQEPRSTCSVSHTALKVYVTLRASLSGTSSKGRRKDVVNQCLESGSVCVCLSFSAFRLQCPPLSEFFTPFPLSQSISDLCLSDCLRPTPHPPQSIAYLLTCAPHPAPPTPHPQSIQIQTMGPVRDTFKLTSWGAPPQRLPGYHPTTTRLPRITLIPGTSSVARKSRCGPPDV